jgi:hypothetical protein
MAEDRIDDLVKKEKAKDYGDAVESMTSCANFWTQGLRRMGWVREKPLSAREACSLMILFKISRDLNINKADNSTDIQGYGRIMDLIEEALKKQNEKS